MTIRIAIIGFGKIAELEHLPAILADKRFELKAVVSTGSDPGLPVPFFPDLAALLDAMAGHIDAVAICTPPVVRYEIARQAIAAGLAVLLEKPPAATLGELDELERCARIKGSAVYAGWHAQHAAGVSAAAAALAGSDIASLEISWREDVRKFHPGQEWIWKAGGFGVFDTGINALSIATRILPFPLIVRSARLLVPSNKQSPIAAMIDFGGTGRTADIDWRGIGPQHWMISVNTADGRKVELRDGGSRLLIDGILQNGESLSGYASIYDSFASVFGSGSVKIDKDPLRIVADAFLVGSRELTEPFS